MLARGAFSDKKVVKMSKKFVAVLVDGDVEREVLKKYRIAAYPTVKFVKTDGKVLSEFRGAAKSRKVLIRGNKALRLLKPKNKR